MAVMSEEVKALFNKVPSLVFSTASIEGQPNSSIVGMKKVIDDETVYVSDQFFNKTLAYGQANAKVALVFWEGHEAYQIHGTARYVNEGEEFEAQKAWVDGIFASMGAPMRAKGGFFVHVDAVYTSTPGPDAGSRIA